MHYWTFGLTLLRHYLQAGCNLHFFWDGGGGGCFKDNLRAQLLDGLVVARAMALPNSPLEAKCHYLFLAKVRTIVKISKTTPVLWVNCILKKRDTVVSLVSPGLTFEHQMELRNAPVYPIKDLLPSSLILQAVEKSSQVLRDEAIQKQFRLGRFDLLDSKLWLEPSHRPAVSHSQTLYPGQLLRRELFRSLLPIPSAVEGKGRNFEDYSLPSESQVEGTLAWYWHIWENLRLEDWTVEVLHLGYCLLYLYTTSHLYLRSP